MDWTNSNRNGSKVVQLIKRIKEAAAQTQIILCAAPENIDGLLTNGFQIVPLAAWNNSEKENFMHSGLQTGQGMSIQNPL